MTKPFEIKQPTRKGTPLRIGLYGLGGSGKTYSSLLLARGLTGGSGIILCDTEQGGAGFYDDIPGWQTIAIDDNYNPERIIDALDFAIQQGAKAIILDSISPAWEGKGGCLEIAENQRYQSGKLKSGLDKWQEPKMLHRDLLDYISYAPVHSLFTCKIKPDYKQIPDPQNPNKTTVVRDGWKVKSEGSTEYSTDINIYLDDEHRANVTKDRTRQLPHQPFVISEAHGKLLADWLNSGGQATDTPEGAAYTDAYIGNALATLSVPPDKRADYITKILGTANPDDPAVIEKLRARLDAKVNERTAQ